MSAIRMPRVATLQFKPMRTKGAGRIADALPVQPVPVAGVEQAEPGWLDLRIPLRHRTEPKPASSQ